MDCFHRWHRLAISVNGTNARAIKDCGEGVDSVVNVRVDRTIPAPAIPLDGMLIFGEQPITSANMKQTGFTVSYYYCRPILFKNKNIKVDRNPGSKYIWRQFSLEFLFEQIDGCGAII